MFKKRKFLKLADIAKKRQETFGPFAKAVLYTSDNGMFLVPVNDIEVGKKLGFEGKYDITELIEIQKHISTDSIVYIIGTHIGTLLVPIAKGCKKVIGYEANPQTFELLQMNLELNKVHNAVVYNYAAGDKEGSIEFYMSNANTGGSKIKPVKDHYYYNFDNPEITKVPMKKLDTHIPEQGQPKPDVIVMDIEGAEYFALKGMQQLLNGSKALYIEFIPHHLNNVAAVSSTDFFDLILPYYAKVKLMKEPQTVYDLTNKPQDFLAKISSMMQHEKDDNLLFYND